MKRLSALALTAALSLSLILPAGAAEHTRLLAFFLTHSPLSLVAELF